MLWSVAVFNFTVALAAALVVLVELVTWLVVGSLGGPIAIIFLTVESLVDPQFGFVARFVVMVIFCLHGRTLLGLTLDRCILVRFLIAVLVVLVIIVVGLFVGIFGGPVAIVLFAIQLGLLVRVVGHGSVFHRLILNGQILGMFDAVTRIVTGDPRSPRPGL
ncbi:hypothetical protein N7492_006231 [Penicillium capsulatum]|uniref:Uncharacterized protein n=1 Tax=Penicillium capsulatum TaxID=69766 RepID=A0A9W9I3D8_9EURO|nr:hypothetical protein N7492_006231 [Penicillium capsulatum]KAJ6108883.1 hypothetical protein N7512_008720 [Penicillium capsulatum]